MGAVPDEEFEANLRFIAPKGTEEQGTVQFKIEADVFLPNDLIVRAGYSANASLVLQQKDSVAAIREALLQFDSKTQEPYVEVQTVEQTFERRELTLGVSCFSTFFERLQSSVKLQLTGLDDLGLVNKVTQVISNTNNVNISRMSFDSNDGTFEGHVLLKVKNNALLKKMVKQLQNINGVHKVVRE